MERRLGIIIRGNNLVRRKEEGRNWLGWLALWAGEPGNGHSYSTRYTHLSCSLQIPKLASDTQKIDNAFRQRITCQIQSSREKGVTTEAGLFSLKNKPSRKGQGSDWTNGQANTSKQCRSRYHNPKQDKNHSSNKCWHLHPKVALDWWKESQAQWKANQNQSKGGNSASAHIFNDTRFFENLELKDSNCIKTGKQGATLPIKGMGSVRLKWGRREI
ncbi:hypothetical protein VP01_51g7 [Puccinia sorghi]|uniref:Uncharacterized protein n=1 Tax=Puccinia sorghi TaxID=27349 RepID=A0A0L6ULF6_9BASI|nr:hypothetical protein VP01_51g7 [Puccinia sorghi]